MEDLFKSFADELEERKLSKARLKPGEEHKASMLDDDGNDRPKPYTTGSAKQEKPKLTAKQNKDHNDRMGMISEIAADSDHYNNGADVGEARQKHMKRLKQMSHEEVLQEHKGYIVD